ncbi:uncharacterized protein LOC143373111 isoform X2 [Andrena cerasifolii]|uniref:uncharacterized protein LOC143373111 isoform X2 n=1 Tax=Andrena cerasifolii TaxID=2819439 RepID=UPI004037604F
MAVASDAMYNQRTVVQSFMSSNTYYGYVPPYRNESQFNAVLEHADINESSVFDRCSFETAMETGDDDGCDYSVASSYLNNNSVILEASARNLLKANHGHQQCQQQPAHNNADTLRRRNRKRCNGDLSPTSELKKFRQGSIPPLWRCRADRYVVGIRSGLTEAPPEGHEARGFLIGWTIVDDPAVMEQLPTTPYTTNKRQTREIIEQALGSLHRNLCTR